MSDLEARVAEYYDRALAQFGASPRGVDWNSEESQITRFGALSRAIPRSGSPSVLDYGCGYGAFYEFLLEWNPRATYVGYDISEAMIETARSLHPEAIFTSKRADLDRFDIVVASGIFNVKLDTETDAWERYAIKTLDELMRLASRSISFNMLTKFSDPDRMKSTLYYADPELITRYCRKRFGRWIAMLADYGLYEFTVVCSNAPVAP